MSVAALRLIHCRRLSTAGPPGVNKVFLWKYLKKIAKVTSAVVCGGCLFITYEVFALNKSVTIDTSAILQEKYKSYIYLSATPSSERENLTTELTHIARRELHKAIRRFLEISSKLFQQSLDEHFSHMDADPHEVALWLLLKRTQSPKKAVRLQAVQELAENAHWQDYQYQTAAQVIDQRTAVGLARTPQVDLRFFRQPPALPDLGDGVSAEDGLRQLLASLPLSEVDRCVQYFTSLALRESNQSMAAQRGGLWCFGGNGLPYAQSLTSVPSEKAESFCLQALVQHSKVQSHCDHIVENGGLQILQRLYQLRRESLKIQRNVVRVIGNLALNESVHQAIVQSGWVSVLAETMKSPHVMQSSHAARALANLDREAVREKYQDGVYILHPQTRVDQPIKADVLFIHGILGAAFKTWRQRDRSTLEEEREADSEDDYTECWPKSWLAADCPNLRVLSVEYDSHLSDWMANCPADNQRKSLAYRSRELLNKLKLAGVGERPVVWVAHSMGGLLVKKMLLDAADDPDLQGLLKNTKGIMFYSVPHHGTFMAEYSVNVRYLLFPSIEVRELCKDSPDLRSLNEGFLNIAKENEIKVLSFAETQPTNVSPMIKILVVPTQSADLGLGELIKVDVDHLNICKPEKKNSFLYKRSLQFIQEALQHFISQ
ncbi:protein SERAC1 isoform X2 [Poeciliopsis prolifica]|uniref:protein SERAC1 isoform X2 n=1 Tax=Poeciliopsis prolifica TaxID=188132 RepID=UPI00241430C2|nr:protein SERAC1 isoform X2 [Poeciliopsis prolifica]